MCFLKAVFTLSTSELFDSKSKTVENLLSVMEDTVDVNFSPVIHLHFSVSQIRLCEVRALGLFDVQTTNNYTHLS